MKDISCLQCNHTFQFDPNSVWTSPGVLRGPQPGIPAAVVIQCPKCRSWLRTEISTADLSSEPKPQTCS